MAEMRRLFNSRPFMSFFRDRSGQLKRVMVDDSIYLWAVECFSGKHVGEIAVWNDDMPDALDDSLADCVGRSTNSPAYIRISSVYRTGKEKGKYRSFESLWWSLVFELNNLVTALHLEKLTLSASTHSIERDRFIEECARKEYSAIEATRSFYESVWLPWAKKADFESIPETWTDGFSPSYEEWIKRFDAASNYPYGYFGRMYDDYSSKKGPPK